MKVNDIVRHVQSGKLYRVTDVAATGYWGVQVQPASPDSTGPRYFDFGPVARTINPDRYTVVGEVASVEPGVMDLKGKRVVRPANPAEMADALKPVPEPVKIDSRICFAIAFFKTEAEAARFAKAKVGATYNGGYFDGMPCGREKPRDYVDEALGQLYAVTF